MQENLTIHLAQGAEPGSALVNAMTLRVVEDPADSSRPLTSNYD